MDYVSIFANQYTTRDITESKPDTFASGATGWTLVKVGTEEVVFNVAIDRDQLAQMARTAARNKSQRCKDGAVLVEVVSRKRLTAAAAGDR
jgi:heme O synthase-like polyprenyltransferase